MGTSLALFGAVVACWRTDREVPAMAKVLTEELCMTRAQGDPGLFVRKNENGETRMMIGMHVDDLFVIASDARYMDRLREALGVRYDAKNVKETLDPQEFLGFGDRRNETTNAITLTQTGYVDMVYERFKEFAKDRKETYAHSGEDMRVDLDPKSRALGTTGEWE